jgi:hypothetical protein
VRRRGRLTPCSDRTARHSKPSSTKGDTSCANGQPTSSFEDTAARSSETFAPRGSRTARHSKPSSTKGKPSCAKAERTATKREASDRHEARHRSEWAEVVHEEAEVDSEQRAVVCVWRAVLHDGRAALHLSPALLHKWRTDVDEDRDGLRLLPGGSPPSCLPVFLWMSFQDSTCPTDCSSLPALPP